jgi:hypothetical protein
VKVRSALNRVIRQALRHVAPLSRTLIIPLVRHPIKHYLSLVQVKDHRSSMQGLSLEILLRHIVIEGVERVIGEYTLYASVFGLWLDFIRFKMIYQVD